VGLHNATACLVEVTSGRVLGEPRCHNNRLSRMAFSPDGTAFAAGCADGSIHRSSLKVEVFDRENWRRDRGSDRSGTRFAAPETIGSRMARARVMRPVME
jgi:WD40 repeat protein